MSSYKEYPPADLRLIGYDPVRDLPQDHLARLVDRIVDEAVTVPERRFGVGQPAFTPRLPLKVLVYAYCIGVRSSRHMERMCRESLPFLLLTRGVPAPGYRTLCTTRVECQSQIEEVFQCLFAVASEVGLPRLGRIPVDSTKFRAKAGPEAVVRQNEYAAMREELKRILVEAAEVDAREDREGAATETIVARSVPADQMRDILRRVRGQRRRDETTEVTGIEATPAEATPAAEPEPKSVLGHRMRERIVQAVAAIDAAEATGLKHVCLTDPDARMLGEGRTKQIRECHSFEVATDNGLNECFAFILIVAAGATTMQDNDRLLPLVEMAIQNEPAGIAGADGDCGFWKGDSIAKLEKSGIETCIPNIATACDIRRGLAIGTTLAKQLGKVPFTYNADTDSYSCPEGNTLIFVQQRIKAGQTVRLYRAVQTCENCCRASACLTQKKAKRRSISVAVEKDLLKDVLARFNNPEHRARYHKRAPAIETIFGFVRNVLGVSSWRLRSSERVSCEASLFKTAYQFRKVHTASARYTLLPQGTHCDAVSKSQTTGCSRIETSQIQSI